MPYLRQSWRRSGHWGTVEAVEEASEESRVSQQRGIVEGAQDVEGSGGGRDGRMTGEGGEGEANVRATDSEAAMGGEGAGARVGRGLGIG